MLHLILLRKKSTANEAPHQRWQQKIFRYIRIEKNQIWEGIVDQHHYQFPKKLMENLNPILIFKFMKIFWPPTIQTKKHLALIVNNTIVYKCSNLRIIISYNFMFKTTRYNMYNHCKKRSNHKRKTEVICIRVSWVPPSSRIRGFIRDLFAPI